MASAIAEENLMTAYGYAGKRAIAISNNVDTSRDSVIMNAKMYAEVFKFLGWVGCTSEEHSYPIVITYLGAHVAISSNPIPLLIESTFGMTNPNEMFSKTSYFEKNRPMLSILRAIDRLGFIYKHEMCMSAMNCNDDKKSFDISMKYIEYLRLNVQNHKEFERIFEEFSKNLKMAPTSVDNCTRFPIAKLKDCKLIEDVSCYIYGRKRTCFKLTNFGKEELYKRLKMYDLRKEEFDAQSFDVQNALIRLGVWSILSRSNFDIDPILKDFYSDRKICEKILKGKELLFSPIQVINYPRVCKALSIEIQLHPLKSKKGTVTWEENECNKKLIPIYFKDAVNPLHDKDLLSFFEYVKSLNNKGYSEEQMVSIICNEHKKDNKDIYYPFIALLFRAIGVQCFCSRSGDNGARWDAIIKDNNKSIPIEIKSPSEEEYISVKAIRQACENKIVLLSRQSYPTKREVSSFAVGYGIPNDRADVNSLIKAFENVFKIKIAVFGLRSLLHMAVRAIVKNKSISVENLSNLGGIYDNI